MTAAPILAVIFSGVVAIILVGGFVSWGNTYFKNRSSAIVSTADEDVLDRLSQIERRLTDTQDVMLALSEKLDRWEEGAPVIARPIDEHV
ncbi:MAG: hypothetical protein HN712_07935 [Gemmatimonadetes bacterium]|nr:hypothetical protein [Gemmatimonadota bacterium]MBT7860228.1 hypothetical protein [Gemmatimonadota bacterium]